MAGASNIQIKKGAVNKILGDDLVKICQPAPLAVSSSMVILYSFEIYLHGQNDVRS